MDLTGGEAAVSRDYASGQLVGIDLHRRRSVICRLTASACELPLNRAGDALGRSDMALGVFPKIKFTLRIERS
jgi:hypothetical protein